MRRSKRLAASADLTADATGPPGQTDQADPKAAGMCSLNGEGRAALLGKALPQALSTGSAPLAMNRTSSGPLRSALEQ